MDTCGGWEVEKYPVSILQMKMYFQCKNANGILNKNLHFSGSEMLLSFALVCPLPLDVRLMKNSRRWNATAPFAILDNNN